MADQKISELTAASTPSGADLFPIVQGGTNKKLTFENMMGNISVPVVINPQGLDTVPVTIKSDTDDYNFYSDAANNKIGIGTNTPNSNAKLDVAGNVALSNGFLMFAQTPQTTTASGTDTISLTKAVTVSAVTGSTTLSLAAGVEGQVKIVVQTTAQTATITGDFTGAITSVVLNAVGESVMLMYLSGAWHIIGGNGFTTA
jgi:hypothetical protein